MYLAIVGTSNSILKGGYSFGIRDHPQVSQLDNFSLGASTTVVLPKVAAERNFENCDFVLFDFRVNEEQLVPTGATSIPDINDRLLHFISSKIRHFSTIPVIIIFPMDDGGTAKGPVAGFYSKFALAHGYPCFDGYQYIAGMRDGNGGLGHLFKDRGHLRPEIAYDFGLTIAQKLSELDKSKLAIAVHGTSIRTSFYHKLTPHERDESELVRRSTSISQQDFVKIQSGNTITVLFPEPCSIVGLELNIAQCNAELIIRADSGSEQRTVELKSAHYRGDDQFLCHMVTPVKPLSGRRFEFSIAPSTTDRLVAEIAGFTLMGPLRTVPIPVWQ